MQQSSGDYQKYQMVSKIYKEIVQTITDKDLTQVKLCCTNIAKKISAKEKVYQQFLDTKTMLDNFKEAKGKTLIHYACARGDVSIVSYLIETIKLDYQVKDKEGNNPFFTAVEHGCLDLVRYFVEELKISALSLKEGDISALHIASNSNNLELMEYLIGKGCDIQKLSIYGKPINWAVGSRHIQATKYLLQKGVNPNGDQTCPAPPPIILAIDFGCRQIYDALVSPQNKIKANLNIKEAQGYTALHIAAEKGNLDIVKDLVERGAEVDVQAQGKKPLYLAFENSKMEVVMFLRKLTKDSQKIQKQAKEEQQKVQVKQVDKPKAQQIKKEGNVLYSEKNYDQALLKYQEALKFDSENEVIHRNIAACYLPLKKYQQALHHCQKAKNSEAKNVKTIYREAQAYMGLNDYVEAAASLWQCAMLQPQTPFFHQEFKKYVEIAKKQKGNG